jgi:type IV secretion system protein VirB9
MLYFRFIILLLLFAPTIANARIIESRPLPHDSRIRVFTYTPDHIYKYVGNFRYQASLKFGADETIVTVTMGDSSGWQIEQSGSRMFLRPLNGNAETNMMVITDKRMYQFEMHALEAESIEDVNLVFETRFLYNNQVNDSLKTFNSKFEPDFTGRIKYNFNYTYSGPKSIAPIKIFDDGEFTYFEFRDKNTELPAIFNVDSKGYEGLVNYRVSDNYVIVERVTSVFTLRHGSDTICVFNEALPYKKEVKKK